MFLKKSNDDDGGALHPRAAAMGACATKCFASDPPLRSSYPPTRSAEDEYRVALLVLPLLLLPLAAWSLPDDGPDDGPQDGHDASEVESLLKTPAPVDDGDVQLLEDWDLMSCAGCHETIAEEWARTRHGQAWVHGHYQKQIGKKRRPQSCHGCHIPEPMHLGELGRKPTPRDEELEKLHFGISCRTCHEGPDGTILGPWGAPTDAHESVQGSSFTSAAASNQLCISCHRTTIGPVIGIAKDFEVTGQEGKGLSCVGCHMAPVERPVATDDDDQPTQVRKGRSHLLQTPRDPAFLALAFGLEARREGDSVVVVLSNQAGHRVPGLTERVITFEAEVLDAAGEVLEQGELELTTRAYLAVDEENELRIPASGGAQVRVRGLHDFPGVSRPVEFLDRTLPLK